jgi:hypothetical protein
MITAPRPSKKAGVLALLLQGKSITQAEALVLGFGTRLADLIHRLKKDGHNIVCDLKEDIHGTTYGSYRLVTRNRFGDRKKAA